MSKQFLKVMFGTTSGADPKLQYKIDELNEAAHWNPNGRDPIEMGGFNIATEKALIRWIFRGDTLYDVIIPDDAELIYVPNEYAYDEIARVNKVIVTNPRPMTDELALWLYKNSNFPQEAYYRVLAGCAIMGYTKTCETLINERISPNKAQDCINAFNGFITPKTWRSFDGGETYEKVVAVLEYIKTLNEIYSK